MPQRGKPQFGMLGSYTYGVCELYTGQELDQSDLYYYGARYYDPRIGQFTQADEVLTDGPNRYRYVKNNPIKANDPSGKAINFVVGAIVGLVVSVAVDVTFQLTSGNDYNIIQTVAAAIGGAVSGAITSGGSAAASLVSQSAGRGIMLATGAIAGGVGSATATTAQNGMTILACNGQTDTKVFDGVGESLVAGAAGGAFGGALSPAPAISALAPAYIREGARQTMGTAIVGGARAFAEGLRDGAVERATGLVLNGNPGAPHPSAPSARPSLRPTPIVGTPTPRTRMPGPIRIRPTMIGPTIRGGR